jgi:TetR/AcrR family transcriptional repressor of nem operon
MATSDTRTQLLERAFELVETRGYDGFSFADLAESVGIRKASIHHHFPTKADLGKELVERFRVECRARLEAIDRDLPPRNQLEAYATIFVETFDGGRMCLCGILAAGFVTATSRPGWPR